MSTHRSDSYQQLTFFKQERSFNGLYFKLQLMTCELFNLTIKYKKKQKKSLCHCWVGVDFDVSAEDDSHLSVNQGLVRLDPTINVCN